MVCGTASIESRVKEFTNSVAIGFLLEGILEDLDSFKKTGSHSMSKHQVKLDYQKVLDLFIKHRKTNPTLLNLVMQMRDGLNVYSEEVIGYIIKEVSDLNLAYYRKSSQIISEGIFFRYGH